MVPESPDELPAVLTIAGSDSGGGAGIQADLKTFAVLSCFGTCAITCVTAQNPDRVDGVEPISPSMVTTQLQSVCDAFPVTAAKTGMLYSAEIIGCVADFLRARPIPILVVDPVMVATSGARLLRDDAVDVLMRELLPLATVTTPNIPEAEVLSGRRIVSLEDAREAAIEIAARYRTACLLKGGHLFDPGAVLQTGDCPVITDILAANGRALVYRVEAVTCAETHGTGCTFAAALTARLARGRVLADAAADAQAFVAAALRNAALVGRHRPLGIGAGRWR